MPTLLSRDIPPKVMREFEDACIGFFDHKDIPVDKQVKKLSMGSRTTVSTTGLPLTETGSTLYPSLTSWPKLKLNYLDSRWEVNTRCETLAMVQGKGTFWMFSVNIQKKNLLLLRTPSHLPNEKIHRQLKANMDECLSKRCNTAKLELITDFKKWELVVHHLDEEMWEELKTFEVITLKAHNNQHVKNVLAEPSRKLNTSTATSSNATQTHTNILPKLTQLKCMLLFNNESCLKCWQFFAGHISHTCPNSFLDPTKYHPLMQADVDYVKCISTNNGKGKSVNTVMPNDNENTTEAPPSNVHPVAMVIGIIYDPVTYNGSNASSMLERKWQADSSDSSDSNLFESTVSMVFLFLYLILQVLYKSKAGTAAGRATSVVAAVLDVGGEVKTLSKEQSLAPLCLPHMYWKCMVW